MNTQATNLSFNSVTSTTITASFTAATAVPSGYLVVRSTSATPPTPVDGTTYAIGSTALGANTNVIANGSSTSFTSYRDWETDRKSTRLNSSHSAKSRMPSSA